MKNLTNDISPIKTEIKLVTPDLARTFLKSQTKNRKWRREVINRYKSEMISDKWHLNGQPIIFDVEGHLMDGQHRLMALIEANKTLEMFLVYGINETARETIDIGKSRSMGDIFQMSGIRNARLLSRTSKLLYIWSFRRDELFKKGMFTKDIMNISPNDVFEFYLANKIDIDRACSEFRKNTEIITGFSAPVLSFTFHVLEKVDLEKCYVFFTSLTTGRIKSDWEYMRKSREEIIGRDRKIRLTESERISIIFGIWNVIYNGAKGSDVEAISLNIPNELLINK